jgi:hypothetical protein
VKDFKLDSEGMAAGAEWRITSSKPMELQRTIMLERPVTAVITAVAHQKDSELHFQPEKFERLPVNR